MRVLALALTPGNLGDSLREGFFMFWETLWALVLGFGLSGVVQAFASREDMQRLMGDHGALSVARATGLGMVSSSCSYAASAMSKSLFQKGADFVSSMVFMFASTNLVLELGVVLIVLMGWQFAAAEFIGGPIMIVLLVALGSVVLRGPLVEQARRRLQKGLVAGHDHQAMVGVTEARQEELERTPWSVKLRSRAAWADAASYTMADITMLRKELVIGYVVAGVLAVMVPINVWNVVFFHGHGVLTTLENVALGPFIAFISFVCSIGNVPMAAALWHGGISFGGVISFIFADLIAFPLVLIYRKYYGTKLTIRLFAVFYVVMAAAGALVEGLFAVTGLIPSTRPREIVATSFQWNYTTFLNTVFIGAFAGLYWLHRNRERLGGGVGYATDPVCGMQVETGNAPAHCQIGGREFWFCSDGCMERFEASPDRFESARPTAPGNVVATTKGTGLSIDPVCGMSVEPSGEAPHRVLNGETFYFCCEGCAGAFESDPEQYLAGRVQP